MKVYRIHIEADEQRADVMCRGVRRAKLEVPRACVGRRFERDASLLNPARSIIRRRVQVSETTERRI